MSMFSTIGGRFAVSGGIRGSVIGRIAPGVSVTARMTQLAWQNMFGSDRWLTRHVRTPLIRAASMVRTHARRSFPRSRYREFPPGAISSKPGGIPYVHATGGLATLKNIQWYPSKPDLHIFVGPAYVPTRNNANLSYRVPGMLEKGGSGRSMIARKDYSRKFYLRGKKIIPRTVVPTNVRIEKRPYMVPAMNKAMKNYPEIFRNITGRMV